MRLYHKTTMHPYCFYLTQEEMDVLLGDPRGSAELLIDMRVKARIKFGNEQGKSGEEVAGDRG